MMSGNPNRIAAGGDRPAWYRFAAGALICVAALSCEDGIDPGEASWILAWSDEFDGPAGELPNPANWTFDIGTDWGNAQTGV